MQEPPLDEKQVEEIEEIFSYFASSIEKK